MFKSSFNQILGSILAASINLIIVIFTARILGAVGRGEITYFVTCLGILQILTSVVGNSVMVFMLTKHHKGNVLISSLIWTLTIVIACFPFLIFLNIVSKAFIFYFLILAIFQTSFNNILALFSSELKFKSLAAFRVLQPLFLIVLILIFYNFFKFNLNLYWKFLIISYMPFFFIYCRESFYNLKFINKNAIKSTFYDFLKLGGLNQFTFLMQFLSYRFAVFVIAKFLNIDSLGVFGMWLTFTDALWLIPISLATVNMAYAAKPDYQLKIIYKFIALAIAIPLTIILVFSLIPNSIFILVLSKDFSQVKSLILYSAPAIILFSINLIMAYFFSAKGLIKYNTLSSGIGFVSILSTTYLFTTKYGLIGAVLSNSLSYFLTVLVTIVIFYNKFYKLNPYRIPLN